MAIDAARDLPYALPVNKHLFQGGPVLGGPSMLGINSLRNKGTGGEEKMKKNTKKKEEGNGIPSKMIGCQTGTEMKEHSGKTIVRYNLSIPAILMENLQGVAEEECTSVLEIIRRFIKLGLIAVQLQKDGGKLTVDLNGKTTVLHVI